MLAVNYTTIRNNLKNYCDKVTDNYETVIITRKDEKNVVIIRLEEYNRLMKFAKNAEYLNKIDRAIEQLANGRGTVHELIEVEDDKSMGRYRSFKYLWFRTHSLLFRFCLA